MVRVFLKGGVWKNSEDEILKAAVQKYGKQQWARVASLLNRKTAKQAKARWYEWLDPSIKKTEWSTSEEEQLLHLVKLLPSQWKTIASAIGRTAIQCQEHYEELLDQVALNNNKDGTAATGTSATSTATLRAGQIDSHPESKPARPDPIDMDEDEMEMLQEARARLANTQGKKAKRKQRERTLEAAKRFADLQKRRELKQAGLLTKNALLKSKKSKREIDYGVEIPFYKPAPIGFHNIQTEAIQTEQIRIQQLKQLDYTSINEQQYRSRDKNAAQLRKREEYRMKILQQTNDKYSADGTTNLSKKELREQQIEDDGIRSALKNRIGPLTLSEPTISDNELHHIAKLSERKRKSSNSNGDDDDNDDDATTFFDTDNNDNDDEYMDDAQSMLTRAVSAKTGIGTTATGMATIASAASRRQGIMTQAAKLHKQGQIQKPLLLSHIGQDDDDDDNNDSNEEDADDDNLENDIVVDDDDDRKPAAKRTSTTSLSGTTTVAATTMRSKKRRRRNTYDDTASIGDSTLATSASDMNSSKSIIHVQSIRELAQKQKRAEKRIQDEITKALASLPQPQYEYELEIPEEMTTKVGVSTVTDDDDYDDDNKSIGPTDRADVEAEEQRQFELQARKIYEQRNSVIKRSGELPRIPVTSYLQQLLHVQPERQQQQGMTVDDTSNLAIAQQLVDKEMTMLILHDANEYPLSDDDNDEVDDNDDIDDSNSKSSSGKKKRKSKKKKSKRKHSKLTAESIELENYTETQLNDAKQLIQDELTVLVDEQITSVLDNKLVTNRTDAYIIVINEKLLNTDNCNDYIFSNDTMSWILRSTCTKEQIEQYIQYEINILNKATKTLHQQNNKLDTKITVLTNGYNTIANNVKNTILQKYTTYVQLQNNYSIYKQLQIQEEIGASNRIVEYKNLINTITQQNIQLQKQYGQLLIENKKINKRQHSTVLTNTTTTTAATKATPI